MASVAGHLGLMRVNVNLCLREAVFLKVDLQAGEFSTFSKIDLMMFALGCNAVWYILIKGNFLLV